MATKRRPSKSLKRTIAQRSELKTIVVFCEGKVSEPDYVNGLKRLPEIRSSTSVTVKIHPDQGVPLTLVRLAVESSRDREVDECWCLFDVEWPQNHPNLPQAIDLAARKNIKLAVSNPCFELWLVLHHRDHAKCVSTDEAERARKKLDGQSGKSLDANFYLPHRALAAQRAVQLEQRHKHNGTEFPRDNPSSGMHRFLAAVDSADQSTSELA